MTAWIVDEYPAATQLSRSEAMTLLDRGPDFELFAPWAVFGEVRTDRPASMPFGVAHWWLDAEGTLRHKVRVLQSEESARWALEHLYRQHRAGCRCVAVFYWTPSTVNYGANR